MLMSLAAQAGGLKRGYNLRVPRAALFLLALTVLSGSLQAQRVGPVFHGSAGRQRSVSNRPSSRRSFAGNFRRRGGYGSYFVPDLFPDYEPFGYEQIGDEPATSGQPQAVIQRTPEPPIPQGQLIEISAVANSGAAKPVPPAIFILASGERLESRRFVLTARLLSVSIDRRYRTVPLEGLDINATLAANRERGIDLRIPNDGNEISLGF